MKFFVETKEEGTRIRNEIKEDMKNFSDEAFFTLAYMYKKFGHIPDKNTYYKVWKKDDMKKLRLRETKNGWFLYLPEPEDHSVNTNEDLNFIMVDEDYFYMVVHRTLADVIKTTSMHEECRVKRIKRGKQVEELGYFYGIFQNSMPNSDGVVIQEGLAFVRMLNGEIRRVRPDHVIFGWEDD